MSTDYARLRLKHHGDPVMMDRILQEECREKCMSKLPSLLTNEDFRFPSLATAEMATSEAVAELHTRLAPPAPATMLDMTCGLGVDAYTFAAKGYDVTAFDIDPATAREAEHNASILGLNNLKVCQGDSLSFLSETDRKFDIIFADPARRDTKGRHYALRDCHPDIPSNLNLIQSRCSTLIVKTSPMVNPCEFDNVRHDTHIIGTPTECKEVVFVAGDRYSGKTVCHTIGHEPFLYIADATPVIEARTGNMILIPFPSIMKAGGNVCVEGTWKADRFSHLYFSDTEPLNFPGIARRVIDVMDFDKSTIKKFATLYPKINVSARNFPLSAPELVKRLKVKEGGNLFLYATTLSGGRKILVVAE